MNKTTHEGSHSILYKLPPAMWGTAILGYMSSHVVTSLYPSTTLTGLGCTAGAMLSCPVAFISAFALGSCAFAVKKDSAGPVFNTTLFIVYPLSCYKLTHLISSGPSIVAGLIVLASLALSVSLAMVLYGKNKNLLHHRPALT